MIDFIQNIVVYLFLPFCNMVHLAVTVDSVECWVRNLVLDRPLFGQHDVVMDQLLTYTATETL